MYATLRNNQLITPGHDGEQFVVDVDGPGIYQVRTCTQRGDVVELGSGMVEVTETDIHAELNVYRVSIPITDHKVEILAPAKNC